MSTKDRHPAIGLRVGILILLLLMVAFLTAVLYFWMQSEFSVQAVVDLIRSWGMGGVAASIGLMILHSFVPFPAEFLAIANGLVYGAFWGTVITWTGAMLGAFLAFGLSRALGRPFVEAMISKNNWQVLDEWAAASGGRIVLISRFIPIIAFNLINYAAGLTRISWWSFTWATAIGILPLTILMVVMGDHIEDMDWKIWILVFLGGAALWFILRPKLHVKAKAHQ